MSSPILVTGSAGFIGYHLCQRLLADGFEVIGLDAMTDYYDVSLKERRLSLLKAHKGFTPILARLEAPSVLENLFAKYTPRMVVHLAAQAGVRYSIDAPRSYVESNINGTFEILEAARNHRPEHLLIASTSSVYGANTDMPYREVHKVDTQMSFYAATKKATEAMAQTYAHLYDIPTTMFRFFTVYGPWGRIAPWRAVNIGNGSPTKLLDFIEALEEVLGKKAQKNMLDIQPGDMPSTWADATLMTDLIGPMNSTELKDGVAQFVQWYMSEYKS